MSSLETCDFEDGFNASYVELVVSLSIFIPLQLTLFCHTMYYEWKSYRKHHGFQQTKLRIRITFIAMQLAGLDFTINEFFRFILDPYFKFVQKDLFSCSLVAYTPKIIVIIYFAFYLFGVLFRLEISFKGSILAINKISFILLATGVMIPAIVISMVYFIDVDKPCIWRWKPIDISVNDDFYFCDFHTEGIANTAIGIGILWVVTVNVIYGIIFGVKLRALLRLNSEVNSFALKSLIIKNTILTTIASVSTLFNWTMWLIGDGIGISFLYLDMWFNCFMIALMFKYNEKGYKKLCRVCIICCLMDCDKTYNKQNRLEHDKQMKKTEKYLKHRAMSSDVFSTSPQTELSVPLMTIVGN